MKNKFKEFFLINAFFLLLLLIAYLLGSLFTLDLKWVIHLSEIARGLSVIVISLCYCVMFGLMEK